MSKSTVIGENITAGHIKEALHRKYCGAALTDRQWVCIEEARSGAGFNGNDRQCDFLAINSYRGRGMDIIGHEIKVSLADWRNELKQPDKAETFARYCRRWWVVVPVDLAAKIKDEVPPAWGLLSLSARGSLREVIKAPRRDPLPVPEWWWVGWLAQIDRQTKSRVPQMVEAAIRPERDRINASIDERVERRVRANQESTEQLRENANRLREITGINLHHIYGGTFDQLEWAYRLVQGQVSLNALATQLRRAADSLDAALTTEKVHA